MSARNAKTANTTATTPKTLPIRVACGPSRYRCPLHRWHDDRSMRTEHIANRSDLGLRLALKSVLANTRKPRKVTKIVPLTWAPGRLFAFCRGPTIGNMAQIWVYRATRPRWHVPCFGLGGLGPSGPHTQGRVMW